jgi:lauroyl/myristoyl acyltransferase
MKKVKKSILRPLMIAIDIFFLGFFQLTRLLAHIVPARILFAMYAGLGYSFYYLMPGARKRSYNIISQAMPEATDTKRIKYIARKSASELFKAMIDLTMFARHGDRIASETSVDGIDDVDNLLAKGKGGICVASHVGGWAISMALMGHKGYLSTPIVMNPDRTLTPRLIKTVIEFADSIGACNGYILTGDDAIRKSEELLAQSGILVMTVDVVGRHVVDMFGRPAALASGAGNFAYETKSPMMAGAVLREKGTLKYRIVFGEEIHYDFTGDRDTDVHNLQQLAVEGIEKQIRLVPDQWTQWGALGGWWSKAERLEKRSRQGQ